MIQNRFIYSSVVIFFVVTLIGCGKESGSISSEQRPKMDMHRVQAGNLDGEGWCIAQSTGGHFQIKIPGHFNDFTISAPDTNGNPVMTFVVGTVTADNTKYSASLISKDEFKRVPPNESFLNGFLDDLKAKGTLKHSEQISYQGNPCLQAEAGDASRSAAMRVILHNNEVFLLVAEFDTDRKDPLKKTIGTFMDSLEFASITDVK